MHLTVEHRAGDVPVTIMRLHGELDASNFQQVIAKAEELYADGVRALLLDMQDVPFMGSSGLVALHSIAMLLRGDQPLDPEYGWQAFHALERLREDGLHPQVKLLNPAPKVVRTLEMTGLQQCFEIHTDLEVALNSFYTAVS